MEGDGRDKKSKISFAFSVKNLAPFAV